MLRDHDWKLRYTPADGNLVRSFYIPALVDADRYDRLTGYFNARALALAARGIEGLVHNGGRMRLLVGCTLKAPEIEAIERGERLRDAVGRKLGGFPLAPEDEEACDALELLAWMIAKEHLDVKVAVPCDENRRPVSSDAIFHVKSGMIVDRAGDSIAWTGSLNETAAGWTRNWESFQLFRSWEEPPRVEAEQADFERLWAAEAPLALVLDVPEAARRNLLHFLPKDGPPARLRIEPPEESKPASEPPATNELRNRVWRFIASAPSLPRNGRLVGALTAPVEPWPHQLATYERLWARWPPRLLIADEVGLGKTIQAGLLLRQAFLSGRAKRILVLAPKAVCRQWQIELREKFNLNWPIYTRGRLTRYESPALRGRHEQAASRDTWHKAPAVIVSSQLMRRGDRRAELLDQAEPWNLVVVDEAHHARRRQAGADREARPNQMLQLLRVLAQRTDGLLLLTATPMQIDPVEVWDLLDLLGLPPEWREREFLQFFEDASLTSPPTDALVRIARLFRAAEAEYGRVDEAGAARITKLPGIRNRAVLTALRHERATTPLRQLSRTEKQAAIRLARVWSPVRHRLSRHTRNLLRTYTIGGHLASRVADRHVEDRFVPLSVDEREVYDTVENYIRSVWNQTRQSTEDGRNRSATGFVLTTYRRRLASSFFALRQTLESRLDRLRRTEPLPQPERLDDLFEDEISLWDGDGDAEDTNVSVDSEPIHTDERRAIDTLLQRSMRLPADTKLEVLKSTLCELRENGHAQVMVFTQYTDTMDFLREQLEASAHRGVLCFSGRGGETRDSSGYWRTIPRDEVKRRFREDHTSILLCTDAAAEGLNFQFCGALVNYDMPWNPMRVEQRIGRIDRIGQDYDTIRIVNLHYKDTVETDVYQVLRERIGLFENVVGRLQPILSKLPRTIRDEILDSQSAADGSFRTTRNQRRAEVIGDLRQRIEQAETASFDLDTILDEVAAPLPAERSPVTMFDLDEVIQRPELLPPDYKVSKSPGLNQSEYTIHTSTTTKPVRVTTDGGYYEEHSDSLEFWSPGGPVFPKLPPLDPDDRSPPTDAGTLRSLSDLIGTPGSRDR